MVYAQPNIFPGEWHTQTPLGFCHKTDHLISARRPGQMIINNKNKREYSGPVAQRIEVLSLYGSRGALSEDSGFNSYPSRPEVYLVKNVVR